MDTEDSWMPTRFGEDEDPAALATFVERIRDEPTWETVFDEHGVLVFRKLDT